MAIRSPSWNLDLDHLILSGLGIPDSLVSVQSLKIDESEGSQTPIGTMGVLGTPLLVTNYSDLGEDCIAWTRATRPKAIEFANTQVVAMRRHECGFERVTGSYDWFAPDGMPLVWCLNWAGTGLRDRVYGPTFMRFFLEHVPSGFSHFLIGGSEECGRRLKERFLAVNPEIRFVGQYHGRCSSDGLMDEDAVVEQINLLSPDFIWVGFGTPKQQAWVHRYKARLKRGVILTVGFGFDVNAGLKPDQPLWMQRLGLGWLFRVCSEPGRLLTRYAKYNFLFLWYLFWDGIRGKALQKGPVPQPRC